MHTGSFQLLGAVFGAEVGVDNIQIRNADLFAFFRQVQRIVDCDIGLAAAIMPGK